MAYIVWEGPSEIDGEPIVVLLTLNSRNDKTGPMAQTWVLRQDVQPWEAVVTGDDESVCGHCPLKRQSNGRRACYVNVTYAPSTIWKAYSGGRCGPVTPEVLRRIDSLRLGAYGDPAAVPMEVWEPLVNRARVRTGYTHQWADPRFQDWRRWIMASVETPDQARAAEALGWRWFGAAPADIDLGGKTMRCPASEEGGHRLQCAQCGMCSGTEGKGTVSVRIAAHGNGAKAFERIYASEYALARS